MVEAPSESYWDEVKHTFPSDAWLRKYAGPPWLVILRDTFRKNMSLYNESIFRFSDVSMVEDFKSGRLRKSLNPIRWFKGLPYVYSYIHALKTRDGYREKRQWIQDHVFGFAVQFLLIKEYDRPFDARIPFIRDGRLVVYGCEAYGWSPKADRALARELMIHVERCGGVLGTRLWLLRLEYGDVYLEIVPEYHQKRRSELAKPIKGYRPFEIDE